MGGKPIWDRTEPNRVHTHVLIIGAGSYPHLLGGQGPTTDPHMDFRQLTSPPISARAFADWVLTEMNNPRAKLGSVELLLSEGTPRQYKLPTGEQVDVAAATMANIRDAFDRWYDRCDEYEDNIGILYFCGHGISSEGERILLAEDYGSDPRRPFETAFNISKTIKAMSKCRSKHQCYFLDACALQPVDISTVDATPLLSLDWAYPYPHVLALGTPIGCATGSIPKQISYFTDALLRCLHGSGSEQNPNHVGQWIVTTGTLVSAMKTGTTRERRDEWRVWHEGADTKTTVHVLPDGESPVVPVRIFLSPEGAIEDADLVMQSVNKHHLYRSTACEKNRYYWAPADVRADCYHISGDWPLGTYQDRPLRETLIILPPEPVFGCYQWDNRGHDWNVCSYEDLPYRERLPLDKLPGANHSVRLAGEL